MSHSNLQSSVSSAVNWPQPTSKLLQKPVQIHSVSSNVRVTPSPHSLTGTPQSCTTPWQAGPRPCTAASTSKTQTTVMGSIQSNPVSPTVQNRQLRIMQVECAKYILSMDLKLNVKMGFVECSP